MEKIIDEKFVQNQIIKYLKTKNWDHNLKAKEIHEKGCDIIVTNSKNKATRFYIECKGKSYAVSAKAIAETNFIFALGQIVTRMKVIAPFAYRYGLGLHQTSAEKALRRIPWQAAKHLCLYIFSVDDNGKVTEYSPNNFKKFNRKIVIKK